MLEDELELEDCPLLWDAKDDEDANEDVGIIDEDACAAVPGEDCVAEDAVWQAAPILDV